MNRRIWKETRVLLPVWCLAVAILLLASPYLVDSPNYVEWGPLFNWLIFGCAVVGALSFGHEFHHKTMPLLLAQPVSRRRLWAEKMAVLAIGLITLMALIGVVLWRQGTNFTTSDSRLAIRYLWLVPVCAFCTTPFWTLVARNGLGGVLFSLMAPPVLFGLLALIGEQFVPDFFRLPTNEKAVNWLIRGEMLVYSLSLYWLGRRLFLKMEWKDGVAESVQLPRRLSEFFAEQLTHSWGGRTGPVVLLVKKEIRLHQLAFLLTGAYAGEFLLFLALRETAAYEWATDALYAVSALQALALPLVLGAVSTAEERNLGVLEGQLVLPIGAWRQWRIKCLTTVGLALALGLLVPAGLIFLAQLPLPREMLQALELKGATSWIVGEMGLVALAMYASTLSPNSIRGLLLGIALWVVTTMMYSLALNFGRQLMGYNLIQVTDMIHLVYWMEGLNFARWVGGCVLVALLLYLGYVNFKSADVTARRLMLHAVAVTIVLLLWVTPQVLITYVRFFPPR